MLTHIPVLYSYSLSGSKFNRRYLLLLLTQSISSFSPFLEKLVKLSTAPVPSINEGTTSVCSYQSTTQTQKINYQSLDCDYWVITDFYSFKIVSSIFIPNENDYIVSIVYKTIVKVALVNQITYQVNDSYKFGNTVAQTLE